MAAGSVDHYCVIGNPVGHSKSPRIHAAFAAQTGENLHYDGCLAPLDGFEATVAELRAAGYRGANVTVPFKLEAFDAVHGLEPRARGRPAPSTRSVLAPASRATTPMAPGWWPTSSATPAWPCAGKRVLLVGAGGAARGVILPLLEQQPASLALVNRTAATAHAVAAHFNGRVDVRGFDDLAGAVRHHHQRHLRQHFWRGAAPARQACSVPPRWRWT